VNRRMSLQKRHDLFAGERLIFEETLRERFEILALLGDVPRCFGETGLHQPSHFCVVFSRWPRTRFAGVRS
jgi:hypothetical protein